MATSTRIAHCPAAPPVRVPHLTPFHIQYSGPALPTFVSNLHPCQNPIRVPRLAVEAQLVSATSTVVAVPEEKENAPAVSAVVTATALATATVEIKAEIDSVVELPPCNRCGPMERLSGSAKRFISSFRGCTVHGVVAPLPEGYSGIVLRGDAEGRTKATTGKAKCQQARKLCSQLPLGSPRRSWRAIWRASCRLKRSIRSGY